MIENVALLYSICRTLKDTFPTNNILIDENDEEIKVPTFSVKISPLKSNNEFSWRKKLLNVYISFVEKKKTQESSLKMINELEELFDENIYVSSRALPIIDKVIGDTSDSVNLTITLNFYDERSKAEPTPDTIYDELMGILKLNIISEGD